MILNKGFDVIISIHDTVDKILSSSSNFIVYVYFTVHYQIYINLAFLTHNSNFTWIWPIKPIFWRVVLVQIQYFETGTKYDPEILHLCGKKLLKLKVWKSCEELAGKLFALPPSFHPEQTWKPIDRDSRPVKTIRKKKYRIFSNKRAQRLLNFETVR